MGNIFTVQTVTKAVDKFATAITKAESTFLQFIVDHGASMPNATEQTWTKAVAPLYKQAFEGRYSDTSMATMVGRVKSIFLCASHGLPVDVSKPWAREHNICKEVLKSTGIVAATKKGAHKKVTAGKAVNTKAAVASEASEAKAKSRRQEVKVYTREQLLEAAFIVTGNRELAAMLVDATLSRRDQLSKALRAICAE